MSWWFGNIFVCLKRETCYEISSQQLLIFNYILMKNYLKFERCLKLLSTYFNYKCKINFSCKMAIADEMKYLFWVIIFKWILGAIKKNADFKNYLLEKMINIH